ncbi:MAG: hypothetical protein M3441_03250 [Chloroflexota bacterium]|nr:hypothetical protein [Chloroflexota bacterium]
MLLSIQFPFADLRRFVENTGKLPAPDWPDPKYTQFVRFFGGIKRRALGGVEGWVNEETICDFRKQLLFSEGLPTIQTGDSSEVRTKVAFRRFYFDGKVAGKFDIAIASEPHTKKLSLSKQQTANLIKDFVEMRVRIRKPQGYTKRLPLSEAGSRLIELYADASTTTKLAASKAKWWIDPGWPALFLELGPGQDAEIPYHYVDHVPLPLQLKGIELYHCFVQSKNVPMRMWVIKRASSEHWADARALRLYLLRLQVEHECLRIVIKHLSDKKIVPTRNTQTSEELQFYFRRALRHIGSLESQAKGLADPEIARIARQSIDSLKVGKPIIDIDALEELDLRYNILRSVIDYSKKWEREAESVGPQQINFITVEGSKYNIGNVQGAVGDSASAAGSTFVQQPGNEQGRRFEDGK